MSNCVGFRKGTQRISKIALLGILVDLGGQLHLPSSPLGKKPVLWFVALDATFLLPIV